MVKKNFNRDYANGIIQHFVQEYPGNDEQKLKIRTFFLASFEMVKGGEGIKQRSVGFCNFCWFSSNYQHPED